MLGLHELYGTFYFKTIKNNRTRNWKKRCMNGAWMSGGSLKSGMQMGSSWTRVLQPSSSGQGWNARWSALEWLALGKMFKEESKRPKGYLVIHLSSPSPLPDATHRYYWKMSSGYSKKSPCYTINIIHVPRSRTSPIITEEKHLTTGKKEGCHEIAASEQKGTLSKRHFKKIDT